MQYRAIFLSDIHLGTPGCQADLLLDFLSCHDAERFYLVGDIVDAWRIGKKGSYWPQSHNNVVQAFMKKAKEGAQVIYVPGNHDEGMRNYLGTHFGGIEVMRTADYETVDGRQFLVTHGDQFDAVVVNAKWLAHVGDRAYEFMLWLNTWVNHARILWGGQYWSLSKWAKAQVKQAVSFIGEYEKILTEEANRGGYDGVICGHIHSATIQRFGDIEYINTGDWVESCTAVVERADGTFKLIDWAATKRNRKLVETGAASRMKRQSDRHKRKDKALT